jgi:hypothetical protein
MPVDESTAREYEMETSELNKLVKFSLQKWAELQDCEPIDFFERDITERYGGDIGIKYKDKGGEYHYHRPAIDHPFMHELIKGLDVANTKLFMGNLYHVINGGDGSEKTIKEDELITMLTASVNNLLLAYYRVFHEKESK